MAIRVTRESLDLLVANVKGRDYLEKELGIKTSMRDAEPVVRVESREKFSEIVAVTGISPRRHSIARRIQYKGVVFQCFKQDEQRRKTDRRSAWA